jgi:hypothetical protein
MLKRIKSLRRLSSTKKSVDQRTHLEGRTRIVLLGIVPKKSVKVHPNDPIIICKARTEVDCLLRDDHVEIDRQVKGIRDGLSHLEQLEVFTIAVDEAMVSQCVHKRTGAADIIGPWLCPLVLRREPILGDDCRRE